MLLEFPQPAMTTSRTVEVDTNSKRTRRGNPNRIISSNNHVRLPGRAKANVISLSPVLRMV